MKNCAQILSHLQHQPQFSKLAQYACIKTVQNLFPPHIQRMIRYGYIRNDVLFFVFSHPGAKQEFDIIIDSIKTPLKLYPPPSCEGSPFSDIKAFVSHKPPVRLKTKKRTEVLYTERAKGAFANRTSNAKLHKIIEEIRQTIHARSD